MPREVIAFYYGWYATPAVSGHWEHWTQKDTVASGRDNITDTPVNGVYDSHDRQVVDRQLRQMHAAGITALVSSWWGQGDTTDKSLDLLAELAPHHALKLSAYYEKLPNHVANADRDVKVDAAVADLVYLVRRHAGQPGWLRIEGRPVFFVFRRAVQQLGPEGWARVRAKLDAQGVPVALIADTPLDVPTLPFLATFDGVHSYNDANHTAGLSADQIRKWAIPAFASYTKRWSPLVTMATIFPGFDNRRAAGHPDGRSFTSRNAGGTFAALGQAALAAHPDWLLVTSWNEWHEGSEVEPSVEYGNAGLVELKRLATAFMSR